MSLSRKKLLFYLIMILLPVIFLGLFEIILRTFNYGYDTDQWINASDEKIGLNPEIARKYFQSGSAMPISIQDTFDKEKKENSFRVFVLGGSSAAGYPFMPLGSFSRYLKTRLELVYPETNIEVVNLAMTAVNSYTIRDLIPGILEKEPDLILIYAGHNEYYGALGVGSFESLGQSSFLINTAVYMKSFKVFQFVEKIVQSLTSIFSSLNKEEGKGTLMSRMAKEKFIPLNSEMYYSGIEQFENNLTDIVEDVKENNVPMIISTIASNLKDQSPFVSQRNDNNPEANDVYVKANQEYNNGNYNDADSLFRLAKDLDALRFRAPEKINDVILKTSQKHNIATIDVDSLFSELSIGGVTGNNLMTDHLHPTLNGYHEIGKLFFKKMQKLNYLPSTEAANTPIEEQHYMTVKNFPFSDLDSTIADFRIKFLKNDYPFVEKKNRKDIDKIIQQKSLTDSLAYKVMNSSITWERAHREIANHYFSTRDITSYKKHVDLLINQYPVIYEYYTTAANNLMLLNLYDDAFVYLTRQYNLKPDAYSAKWIGIIELSRNNLDNAISYLNESLSYKREDSQVLYNLAGAYAQKSNFQKALGILEECLRINPNYKAASQLKTELQNILDKK